MTPLPQNVVELCRALVRIPSVNPAGNPGVAQPGEKACAEFAAHFLEKECGARAELRPVRAGRPNVAGFFPKDREGKPRVIFAPHTDTVSVVGMTIDPFAAELRDGKIFGRGASDTKGPMAAMLWALREMRGEIPALPVEIVFAGLMGEEAGQHGAKAFAAETRADFALIGEPTNCDIVHTHKGSAWLTLRTRGRAAHSSRPELGENAIVKMLRLLDFVGTEMAAEFATILDPVLGAPTVSIGTITGGTKTNIVPESCEATVDLRIVPAQAVPEFAGLLETRLRGVCPEVEIALAVSQPLHTDPANPFIRALENAGGKCTGAPWFCDAAVFAEAGIPAVAAGPGDIAQAHTPDEWIAVEELERGVEFYKKFLLNL